jgi:hypothetical protein
MITFSGCYSGLQISEATYEKLDIKSAPKWVLSPDMNQAVGSYQLTDTTFEYAMDMATLNAKKNLVLNNRSTVSVIKNLESSNKKRAGKTSVEEKATSLTTTRVKNIWVSNSNVLFILIEGEITDEK